jgi:hypothetical protein
MDTSRNLLGLEKKSITPRFGSFLRLVFVVFGLGGGGLFLA